MKRKTLIWAVAALACLAVCWVGRRAAKNAKPSALGIATVNGVQTVSSTAGNGK